MRWTNSMQVNVHGSDIFFYSFNVVLFCGKGGVLSILVKDFSTCVGAGKKPFRICYPEVYATLLIME